MNDIKRYGLRFCPKRGENVVVSLRGYDNERDCDCEFSHECKYIDCKRHKENFEVQNKN